MADADSCAAMASARSYRKTLCPRSLRPGIATYDIQNQDSVIEGIRNDYLPIRSHCYASRAVALTRPSRGEKVPRGVEKLDAVVGRIGDDDRPIRAHCHAPGTVQLSIARALAAKAGKKVSHRVEELNPAVAGICHED